MNERQLYVIIWQATTFTAALNHLKKQKQKKLRLQLDRTCPGMTSLQPDLPHHFESHIMEHYIKSKRHMWCQTSV